MRSLIARCIVRDGNKVLLCHSKKYDFYFIPGGGIEHQELAEDTIYREFNEEMGLQKEDINICGFKCLLENIFMDQHTFEVYYEATLKNNNVKSLEEDDIDFIFQDIDKLDSIKLLPTIAKDIISNKKQGPHFVSIAK